MTEKLSTLAKMKNVPITSLMATQNWVYIEASPSFDLLNGEGKNGRGKRNFLGRANQHFFPSRCFARREFELTVDFEQLHRALLSIASRCAYFAFPFHRVEVYTWVLKDTRD